MFISGCIHLTSPNDIRGGEVTLTNLAAIDDEKVCEFWHCITYKTFCFCNYILTLHFRVLMGNQWPPALQVISITAN